MFATIPLEVRVSVDIGGHQHRVAIGLSSGEVLEEFDTDNSVIYKGLCFMRP